MSFKKNFMPGVMRECSYDLASLSKEDWEHFNKVDYKDLDTKATCFPLTGALIFSLGC